MKKGVCVECATTHLDGYAAKAAERHAAVATAVFAVRIARIKAVHRPQFGTSPAGDNSGSNMRKQVEEIRKKWCQNIANHGSDDNGHHGASTAPTDIQPLCNLTKGTLGAAYPLQTVLLIWAAAEIDVGGTWWACARRGRCVNVDGRGRHVLRAAGKLTDWTV